MGTRTRKDPIRTRRQRRSAGGRYDAKLTRSDVMSAHKLYEAGMSVPAIAEKIWKKKGYVSRVACQNSLYYAFSSYKLRTRKSGRAYWLNKTCSGCGCNFDKKTEGCVPCRKRHAWRKRRDEQNQKALIKERRQRKECLSCGVPQTQQTLGCTTCSERHWKRNQDPERAEKRRAYDREYNKNRQERLAA